MKLLKISAENPQSEIIETVAKVLELGGSVVYPTETVYGLGVNATDLNALMHIFEIKQRDRGKPLSVAFANLESAESYVEFSPTAKVLAREFLPGPLTMILNTKFPISELIGGNRIGVRIPIHKVAQALLNRVKFPITSTSANISEGPDATNADEAVSQIGDKVDIILDAGDCYLGEPSTVIDLSDGKMEILREGAIPKSEIEKLVGEFK